MISRQGSELVYFAIYCQFTIWRLIICECVRSVINFHPQKEDVYIDILEMFFRCFFNLLNMTRTDGWIQNFSKMRDVTALKRQYVCSALIWHTVYCCVIQRLVTSDGSDVTRNDPGHPDNEWGWLSRHIGVLRGSNSIHYLIMDIYRQHSDTVYCPRQGGGQHGNSWSKSFFFF